MATKGKSKKRGKTLAGAKKLKKVNPLLVYNLTDPQIKGYTLGSGS